MSHIAIRKVSKDDALRALMVRCQTAILFVSILILGAAALGATVRLHQIEQQLAADART